MSALWKSKFISTTSSMAISDLDNYHFYRKTYQSYKNGIYPNQIFVKLIPPIKMLWIEIESGMLCQILKSNLCLRKIWGGASAISRQWGVKHVFLRILITWITIKFTYAPSHLPLFIRTRKFSYVLYSFGLFFFFFFFFGEVGTQLPLTSTQPSAIFVVEK